MAENVSGVDTPIRRLRGEVSGMPVVRRDDKGAVSSIAFAMKSPFKGEVEVRARGDIASAYWSLTPGMRVAVTALDLGGKVFRAQGIEVIPAGE